MAFYDGDFYFKDPFNRACKFTATLYDAHALNEYGRY